MKGIAFQSVVDDVSRLVSTGAISQEELTSSLKPEDLEYLEEQLVPTLWYPVDAYTRYLTLLWKVEGDSQEEYLVRRGAAAAERIFESGTYARLMATAKSWGRDQVANMLINLPGKLLNFTRWHLVGNLEDDEFDIELSDARDYPKVAHLAAQGFIEYLHSRASDRDLVVTSERSSPSRVVFHVKVRG